MMQSLLGSFLSSFLLVSFNGLKQGLCLRVSLEVASHWFNQFVNHLSHCWFEIVGMQFSFSEVCFEFCV